MNSETLPLKGEFDYIIVGAGSAGSVMAARLSQSPDISVLMLEQGPCDDSRLVRIPKGFGKLLTDPRYTSYHPTVHDTGNEQPEIWVRGKMLGGSSGINGSVWNRGTAMDYDMLAKQAPGWSWNEMLPYLKNIEDHEFGGNDLHGAGGPIPVRVHPEHTPLHEALIAAGHAIGLPRLNDFNGMHPEGIGYLQSNINHKGERVSAARGFLTPQVRNRSNLTIITRTRVDRIQFKDRCALGVECVADHERLTYRARAEVIVCAGALETPKLLQLSGIGPADVLQAAGISPIHDSPGVGANLREHRLLMQFFKLRDWKSSYNRSFSGLRLLGNTLNQMLTGRGPMAYSSSEIGAFVKISDNASRPDAQLMFSPYSFTYKNGQLVFDAFAGMQMYGYLLRPESSGSLQITSADGTVPARIEPNYLSTESDQVASIGIIRKIRQLLSQAPLQALIEGETPPTANAHSDDEILDAFRRMGQSGYHACGTCRMGRDDTSVVDPRLRVRGVEGVRIMDCSICPQIIAGNTNAPIMAMSWRASDLIVEDARC